jgi:hypothetical protein
MAKKIKRRSFLAKATAATAAAFVAPYILPSGRLYAATGNRVVDHVVFVLFGGGIRNQEAVQQMYLSDQTGFSATGNIMNNMLTGAAPSSNIVYDQWSPLTSPLDQQGTLLEYVEYDKVNRVVPTGHYNAHAVGMTGNYITTGLNAYVNPSAPTVFEYYRKHSDPVQGAKNAWWISEGLGPYPALNYSADPLYGSMYGANYMNPATIFSNLGNTYYANAKSFQPDDISKMEAVKDFLNNNFQKEASDLPGIQNTTTDRAEIRQFMLDTIDDTQNSLIDWPTPGNDPNLLTGDLINIAYAWQVMKNFSPELSVINTFNLDICHSNFPGYIDFLHKADYGIGWLWDKIQGPEGAALGMKDNTIMICIPEHGRNANPNSLVVSGLSAYDHTGDDNSREVFSLIVGPTGKVNQGLTLDKSNYPNPDPVPEVVDIVPTIGHILDFHKDIPPGYLPGRILNEVFV